MPIDSRNVTLELAQHARRRGAAPALAHPGAAGLSYAQLDSLVWRVAHGLHAGGVRPGTVVALGCESEVAFGVAVLALLRLGATQFTIPRGATAHQRHAMAARSGAAVLATDTRGRFECGLQEVHVHADSQPLQVDAQALFCHEPAVPACLVMGSGSTGLPKLIPLTHAQLRGRIRFQSGAVAIGPDDRICSLSPVEFFGSRLRMLESIHHGACFVARPTDTAGIPAHCREQAVSILHATVYHVELLLQALPPEARGALDGLRALVLASSTVGDALRARVRERLVGRLYVRYGTNESGQLTTAGPPDVFELPGTVGAAEPGVQLEVVDASDLPLPRGQVGLVRSRSPGQSDGYAGDEEATERQFRNGWFYPGDMGALDGQGRLVFAGRADDMMIANGVNIYPAEIEREMAAHPDVADVAAMPLSHPVHQHVPVCALVLRGGAAASGADLHAYARERLGMRAPVFLVLLERIPRSVQGKLDRAALARELAQRLAAAPATQATT